MTIIWTQIHKEIFLDHHKCQIIVHISIYETYLLIGYNIEMLCVLTVAINDDDIKYGANMSIIKVTKW